MIKRNQTTEPTNQPTPVILDDEALAEIEARRPRTVHYNCPFVPLSETERDALCQTVRALRAELGQRQRTMKFWEDSYLAEHETWGNCQWKAENTALREQLAEAAAKIEWQASTIEQLTTGVTGCAKRLAQVEKERDELRRQL